MRVVLSEAWLRKAIEAGRARQAYAESRNLKPYGDGASDDDPWLDNHIVGAVAECVVAKVLRVRWDPQIGTTGGIDVGGIAEVRLRRIPGTGRDLAIRPDDKDGKPYVLVHRLAENVHDIVGWLYGNEGKARGSAAGPVNAKRGVWFVRGPYRSIESLIEEFAPVV